MKRTLTNLLSLAVFISISLFSSAQANILTNSSFESGNTDGWAHWCINSTVTDTEKHSGSYSVELGLPAEFDKGALIQEVTEGFSVGKPLYATVWIKANDLDADAFLKLEFWNNDGVEISSIESKKIKSTTSGWTKINVSTLSVPADTTIVKLLLQSNSTSGKGSSGKAYFDDAYLDITSSSAY